MGFQPLANTLQRSRASNYQAIAKDCACGASRPKQTQFPLSTTQNAVRKENASEECAEIPPGLGVRIQQSTSQVHAERLGNLKQAFSLIGVTVTPRGASRQFIQYFWARFWPGVTGEVVPQVLHQLQALKLAKMLKGLKCSFHGQSLSVTAVFRQTLGC